MLWKLKMNGFHPVIYDYRHTPAVPVVDAWAMMVVGFGGLRLRRKIQNIQIG